MVYAGSLTIMHCRLSNHYALQALEELKDFMIIKGVATKERQKLMRNLRVTDSVTLLCFLIHPAPRKLEVEFNPCLAPGD